MPPEITSNSENKPDLTPKNIVDNYLGAYALSILEKNSDLFGSYSRITNQPVKQFKDIVDIVRSENAGEGFCNGHIVNFCIDWGIVDNEIASKAKSGTTTELTVEVASELKSRVEALTSLEPKEQWSALDSIAFGYAQKRIAWIEKKQLEGELDQVRKKELKYLTNFVSTVHAS